MGKSIKKSRRVGKILGKNDTLEFYVLFCYKKLLIQSGHYQKKLFASKIQRLGE